MSDHIRLVVTYRGHVVDQVVPIDWEAPGEPLSHVAHDLGMEAARALALSISLANLDYGIDERVPRPRRRFPFPWRKD